MRTFQAIFSDDTKKKFEFLIFSQTWCKFLMSRFDPVINDWQVE